MNEQQREALETLQKAKEEIERKMAALRVSIEPQSTQTKVLNWNSGPPERMKSGPLTAPNEWIGTYLEGLGAEQIPSSEAYRSSVVRTELEVFDEAALSKFGWIGVFHDLVRKGNQSPDEKLAILRRYLRGRCLDIVSGLGGGE